VSIISYIVKSEEADITMMKKSMTRYLRQDSLETLRFEIYG